MPEFDLKKNEKQVAGRGGDMLTVKLGDVYESGNRSRVVWSVDGVISVPGMGQIVRLVQVDGMGKLMLSVNDLMCQNGFRKVSEVSLRAT